MCCAIVNVEVILPRKNKMVAPLTEFRALIIDDVQPMHTVLKPFLKTIGIKK